jgi:outer membrane protein assembly factor BamB
MITRRLLLLAGLVSVFLAGCGGGGTDGETGGVLSEEVLVGSSGNGKILRFDATTGAYKGVFAQGGGMVSPNGMAQLANGDIVVGDFVTKKVRIHAPDGSVRQDLGELLGRPYAILALNDGSFLVSEYDSAPSGRIVKWTPNTGFQTFITGGELDGPDGMAVRENTLYVSSQRSKEILRYNLNTGAFIDVWANDGFDAPLAGPSGIVFGPGGDLYVTQHDNDPEVTKGGNVLRFDGATGELEGEFIPGGAASGGLSGPIGILLGSGNRFFVSSAETDQVLQFNATGNYLGTFASGNDLDGPIYLAYRVLRN